MTTTNIWAWSGIVYGWELRHREVPKASVKYWLNRHREAMVNAGKQKPLLKAQIKMPKPLIITVSC